MKILLSALAFLVSSYTFACNYTVDLNDTFGDGWNGNSITITVNGTVVLNAITVATNNTYQDFFSANPGDVVVITYDNGGSWQSENEITITSDDLGVVVFTDGMGGTVPTGGSFTVAVNCGIAPPSNDEPCQAINLPMNGVCNPLAASVDGATASAIPNPTCGTYTTQGDVWFETTVGATGLLQIDLTDGGINANMAIYDGVDCNTLNEIGCSISNTFYSDIIPAGTQLWIRVWDENNSIGSFTICAIEPPPPPVNNDPCTAELLTVETTCIPTVGTTTSAINSAVADPSCSWNYQGGDVWYTAIVPPSGFMHVNLTAGGLVDGGIAVYSGVDCNTLTEVACNESTWQMPAPVVITPADALQGQQVWIRIWEGDNDNPGSFEICLVDEPVLFVDPTTYTPDQLVEDILINGCLQASNVQYDGDPSAIAYFEGGLGIFGMASGVVLGSGSAVALTGQGTDAVMGVETTQLDVEADLSTISQLNGGASDMHDEVILEFDFIPSSDTTLFDFVFASSEYPTFENSSFNDVFAFFVSGPGIAGPYADNAINVAIVPGTTDPITISSVNGTTNSAYFAAYTNGTVPNFNVGGYTIPITAVMAGLTPCETYHIKFAIADAGDGSLSSYVFFEESSFSSGGDVTMNNVTNVGQNNEIFEGCENNYIFSRLDTSSIAMQDTVNIVLNIGGTATEGIDYSNIPDTLFILPGQVDFTLYYSAFFDNIAEGSEYILFTLLNGCPCSQTSTSDTIWIRNNFHLDAIISDPTLLCYGDSTEIMTEVNPNIDPFLIDYTWSTGETTPSIMVTPTVTSTYYVTISNVCESNSILNVTTQVIPTIDPDFILSKDTACIGEPITVTFNGSTTPLAIFDWTFNDASPATANTVGPHYVSWATTGTKTIDLHINDQTCLADTSISLYVKAFNSLSLSTSSTDVNCFAACDGIARVSANTGVAPFSYLWDDGRTLETIDQLCPGSYKVTVSDVFGCMDTTHATILSPTEITSTYNVTPASCKFYTDGSSQIIANGGVGPYTYLWSNDAVSENNINIPAGIYSVTITDANACQKVVSNIQITEPNEVMANIFGESYENGEIWICIGATETLNSSATGGFSPYTFQWNTSEIADIIQVSPSSTSIYSLIATDSHGCTSPEKLISVNVYDPISISTQIFPTEICTGDNVNVTINAEGGNGNYIYQLISNNGVENISNKYLFSPSETSDYIISVSDNCTTPSVESPFSINVHHYPEVSFIADKNSGCPPLEIRFSETSSNDQNTYIWEFTDSHQESKLSFERNPTHLFKYSDSYDVKLTVTNEFNCTSELTKHDYITAFDLPIASFNMSKPIASMLNPTISFFNESQSADLYYWSFGDNDSSQQVNPTHIFPTRITDYMVSLIAVNRFGCSDTINQKVKIVDEITFYAPTGFTPDGDGKNEFFYISGNGMLPENFTMKIYDRWGMEIFSTHNINEAWDAKSADGNYVKPGIYSWWVKYNDIYKVSHEKSGYVNVIR